MGKTYRKEKDKYAKREAQDVVTSKQKFHEKDRTERKRQVHDAEVHWQDEDFQDDFS